LAEAFRQIRARRRVGPTDQYVDADNAWGSGLNADRQTAAVDVHFGAE
jgi:hypothetical protein